MRTNIGHISIYIVVNDIVQYQCCCLTFALINDLRIRLFNGYGLTSFHFYNRNPVLNFTVRFRIGARCSVTSYRHNTLLTNIAEQQSTSCDSAFSKHAEGRETVI